MNSFRAALVHKVLILIMGVGCLVQSYRLHCFDPSNASSDADLQNLARGLFEGGLEGRVVAERQDGLLIGAIFLTQTDLNDNEIRRLIIDPNWDSRWHGTVKIYYDPQRQFVGNEDFEYRYGPFLLFGDQELIHRIVEMLGSSSA
jgi:hypothetical protein